MNKSLSRAIAVTAVGAAGLAGALVVTPTATAETAPRAVVSAPAGKLTSSGRLEKTGFGYKADVFGTKLLLEGVELRALKGGYAQQRCTTMAGRVAEKSSILAPLDEITDGVLPEGLIDLSVTKQTSQTYKQGNRTGVRGVSTVGDVSIGGLELPGLGKLPKLKIEGLQSVADAFHDGKSYGHEESFGFKGISLDYEGSVVDGTPLAALLDILNQVTAPISQIVNQVIGLLTSLGPGKMIEIPGLGGIGLGASSGKATAKQGTSEAYALKVLINATGNDTVLQLGRARTQITKAGPAGVFRGTASGANILGDVPLLNVGNLGQRSIPCGGTDGKVQTTKAANYSLLGGLVNVTGVTYKTMGKYGKGKAAKALIGTDLGTVTVPILGLEVKGLSSLVNLKRTAKSAQVKPTVTTKYLQISHNGKPVRLRAGESYDLGDDNFLSFRKLFGKSYHGTGVHGLQLNLAGIGLLDLASSSGRIFPR
ncbi:hypothetical protein [Nocardioides marmotae]|uniref:Uncharacterized protein n=1 Tax=Nocardioides marmotae TaxID=2663857 RepID=A0A6I3JB33_9ACTN|nr:hypothetical protein [Nocardioides marmotae]MCR6031650.1 hypothetical protein [Gordonia jinghuaiqii]MBC9733191.1 hypothetical protein [Nocardioides marmotae]MTB84303.1 hypothetical protein [Nocardioides marmotae]MTB95289.1 hypothetical protein [Nocardioides marmotae]QKE02245.1 hypothetical protein HPC71_15055 [Nocardioides marmotae]